MPLMIATASSMAFFMVWHARRPGIPLGAGWPGRAGGGAVIYLAPPTVPDAMAGEAEIVRRQGLEFINIPIRFGAWPGSGRSWATGPRRRPGRRWSPGRCVASPML
jgi:hypothetical protein